MLAGPGTELFTVSLAPAPPGQEHAGAVVPATPDGIVAAMERAAWLLEEFGVAVLHRAVAADACRALAAAVDASAVDQVSFTVKFSNFCKCVNAA